MSELDQQFDALLSKYTELLLGTTDDSLQQKVMKWALYTHISKSMPNLSRHWNETYPEGKKEMISIISEIKALNEENRKK
ncbi:DUF2573 family protein [Peribacillus kribbensis]|uniref:DUF2573 family protein n=1 Tax=Peribacillus kribbensis TaxID=356658 RepID=UPI00040F8EA6|nr:DUF2573 family protein [Peribacillus kribbensis]